MIFSVPIVSFGAGGSVLQPYGVAWYSLYFETFGWSARRGFFMRMREWVLVCHFRFWGFFPGSLCFSRPYMISFSS
ncbi:hypothetical protein PRUPE_6G012800 [Prunus persica]|uniref:Uncharacterized protein n=1 Tax=Prunus persica TaxID=3760 RepID=A0A251NIH2_PRUPE|nr:hypothetical protein PRUPE_6G012800 [Prunus persica]